MMKTQVTRDEGAGRAGAGHTRQLRNAAQLAMQDAHRGIPARQPFQAMANKSARSVQLKRLATIADASPAALSLQRHQPMLNHSRQNAFLQVSADTALRVAATEGRLTTHQVNLRPITQSFAVDQLAYLGAAMKDISDPSSKPLSDGLAEGTVTVANGALQIAQPSPGDGSPRGMALGVAAMRPKETSLQVQGDRYRVMARLNPWIQVAGGMITAVNSNHHATSPGPGWNFVTYAMLAAGGVNRNPTLIGQPWGGAGAAAAPLAPAYTVPSATFNPAGMPAAFHSLAHDQLPAMPDGYAWSGGGSAATPYVPMRNPVARPMSPGYDVDAEVVGGRLVYSSYHGDAASAHGTRVLGAYAQVAPTGMTYGGGRHYPVSTADFVHGATAVHYGRGHAVDHADGSATTTSSGQNFVPESRDFNSGARNHLVQGLRSTGGNYQVSYQYPAATTSTHNGTAIPAVEHFLTRPTGGTPSYYAVDNLNYPASRSTAAVLPYQQPAAGFPVPLWQP